MEKALEYWSEGIRHYNAVAQDQYGPFRIGPAYPMCLNKNLAPPAKAHAHFGTRIVATKYNTFEWLDYSETSVPQIRIHHELSELLVMEECMEKGIALLENIKNVNDELEELTELGKYIKATVRTAIHAKKFLVAKARLDASLDPKDMKKYIDEMEKIALDEIENAKLTIPLVKKNSRLGWEPSMDYLGDEEHILWKIRQVEYMLSSELSILKEGIKNNL